MVSGSVRSRVAFGVLGALRVEGEAGEIRIPPGRQQTVLSVLLLEVGSVVPTDHLIDVLWDHDPPDTARTQVQICISRLRKLIAPTGATIRTEVPGYVVTVPEDSVDLYLYRELLEQATRSVEAGEDRRAAETLQEAAGLWRGPALSGVDCPALRGRALRLDEERVTMLETRVDIELRLGHHVELISDLTTLVEAYPLREGLRAQLMLALYRAGRQAEALEAYRVGRELLVEHLGLDPGERLRDLEQAILAGDPVLRAPRPVRARGDGERNGDRGGAVPALHQLPNTTSDFVGREDVTETVRSALLEPRGSVGVAVLVGRPGVGKSATAVRIAHELAEEHFPDGQLYCDLRGTRKTPLHAADVLGRFLRALGVPAQALPEDVDERASVFRGLLANRRILIVLDDAASEAQVLPLIPGGSGSGVLITSRSRITGLPGSVLVPMDVLSEERSLALLSQVMGEDRVSCQSEAAKALVRAVGRLPLALRIVAARLAARPHWPIAGMVERLADEHRRLDELSHGDLTVRASLSLTYDGLDPMASKAFTRLGMLDADTIPSWTAGALLDDDRPYPMDLTEPLVDAHMLDVVGVDSGGEPVYRFHDLVRAFAKEKAREDESGKDRRAAVERVLGAWLFLVDEANSRMNGGRVSVLRGSSPRWSPPEPLAARLLADPYAWFETERANLSRSVLRAVDEGMHEQAWELAVGFSDFLSRRGYQDDIARVCDAALASNRRAGNGRGEASLLEAMAGGLRERYDSESRRAHLLSALAGFERYGDVLGAAFTQRQLAFEDFSAGDEGSALRRCEAALAGFREVGDLGGQVRCMSLMGHLRIRRGNREEGRRHLDEALGLARHAGDSRLTAQVLRRVAQAEQVRGNDGLAEQHFRAALDLVEEIDDSTGRGIILRELGSVHRSQGRIDRARSVLEQAREVHRGLAQTEQVTRIDRMLAELGE